MGARYHCGIVALATAFLCLAGCGSGSTRNDSARERPDIYASREPGSDVSPTSDVSFQLLGADGPSRFASLQQLIVQEGKRCASVTKAVIVGGMDGTDEWRVDCSDSGRWQVWLSEDTGASVSQCTNAKCT